MRSRYAESVRALSPMLVALLLFGVADLRLRRARGADREFGAALRYVNEHQLQLAGERLAVALRLSPYNAHYHAHQALLRERALQRRLEPFTLVRPTFSNDEAAQLREAAQSYRRVLELNPADDAAYHNLGWLYWFLREDAQALACLDRAVELDNANPLYHLSLGIQSEFRGDATSAAPEYAIALRLSPNLLDTRFFRDLRVRAPQQAEGVVSETIEKLEAQLRLGFSPVVAGKLGRLYLERQPERAIALLSAVTQDLPNLSRPWANLGYYFELHGDERQMKACYERAVFVDGSDALSWYRLGRYYDRQHSSSDAARCYERAVQLFLNPESVHSGRVRRIYISRHTLFDDVIPNRWLLYTSPSFDLPSACRRLSEIHQAAGHLEEAKRFAELGQKYAREMDFSNSP